MLSYYVLMVVASLIVGGIIYWLYKEVVGAGEKVHRSMLVHSKKGLVDSLPEITRSTAINDTPSPWVIKNRQTPRALARTRTRAALPAESMPWTLLPEDQEPDGHHPVIVNPDVSKTNAQFWRYGTKPNQPGG
jgi:hypothetical protein